MTAFNGWIKLHRKILDHWVSQEPEMLAVWVRLLAEANHSDTRKMFNGALIEIKRGQLIFGLNAFSAKSGVSVAKLRRFLKLFETDNMIDKQNASKYSLITITCFDQYQVIDKQNASTEQADDKQTTSSQQHYKNEKNVENEKNDEKKEIVGGNPPSRFPEFWEIYNYKKGRKKAEDAWKRKKLDNIADEVIDGARRYVQARGSEAKYWKHAQGWLNDERWGDDYIPERENGKPRRRSFDEMNYGDVVEDL